MNKKIILFNTQYTNKPPPSPIFIDLHNKVKHPPHNITFESITVYVEIKRTDERTLAVTLAASSMLAGWVGALCAGERV